MLLTDIYRRGTYKHTQQARCTSKIQISCNLNHVVHIYVYIYIYIYICLERFTVSKYQRTELLFNSRAKYSC